MATRRPAFYDPALGHFRIITSPDTIEPSLLGGSASFVPTRVATGTTFSVPVDSQALLVRKITVEAGASIKVAANSVLIQVA